MSFSMERAPLGSGELGCPSTLFTWLPGSKTTLPDEDLHPWASTSFGEPPESNGSLERNLGWRRGCTTCSKPEASLIRVGSLKAVPRKLMPTGSPKEKPAGRLICGQTTIDDDRELDQIKCRPSR